MAYPERKRTVTAVGCRRQLEGRRHLESTSWPNCRLDAHKIIDVIIVLNTSRSVAAAESRRPGDPLLFIRSGGTMRTRVQIWSVSRSTPPNPTARSPTSPTLPKPRPWVPPGQCITIVGRWDNTRPQARSGNEVLKGDRPRQGHRELGPVAKATPCHGRGTRI